MQRKTIVVPEWTTVAEHLRKGLGYSEATLKRTRHTYNVLVRDFCGAEDADAVSIVRRGIEKVDMAFESGAISRDKLLRLRRLAFRIIQLIETGRISWKCAPLYGKSYGNSSDESLLSTYVETERREHKHADSIVQRDENIIRQYIRYAEENEFVIDHAKAQDILAFLSFMKRRRPAGLKSVASALRHFYIYLTYLGMADANILLAIKPWDTPPKRVYGVFSAEEIQRLKDAATQLSDSETGRRDKAIIMLAIDCGIRSSDICNLKLEDISWRSSSISITQKKTGVPHTVPFSAETGEALADYILNARGTSDLSYVFLKKSYSDSAMTSSLLCQRLKKLMEKAGISRAPSEKISMHTFRRSLGTAMVDSGESLEMVAQVLGHRDKEATKGYIAVSERMLRECPLPMPEINERREKDDKDEI